MFYTYNTFWYYEKYHHVFVDKSKYSSSFQFYEIVNKNKLVSYKKWELISLCLKVSDNYLSEQNTERVYLTWEWFI